MHKVFASILLFITFFDWIAGISGLISVITANLAAQFIGFNKSKIAHGYYGFNALLVGLGIGISYQPGISFLLVLVFAALFTLFLTVWFEGVLGKYYLPYLSWPFLFGIWMVSLATRQFSEIHLSERGLFMINDLYFFGGIPLVDVYHWFSSLPFYEAVIIYFRSLGAIFFQYTLFAGIIVAVGLLIYSRIAFLLSLIGFFTAYFYYMLIGANIYELTYGYIGFNFILTAIAIGGFFVVPSKYSFLWVILLTPIISIIITSSTAFFMPLQLSIYSLAFNVVVVLFLYILKFRERNFEKPELVVYQQFSPEINLYSQTNYKTRFDVNVNTAVILPFLGDWTVSQGHNGTLTHREEWQHAWDFEMLGDDGEKYKNLGNTVEDYYCYNKPVTAPADGFIQEIQDGIEDNVIGQIDFDRNWGNTVIIKHDEKLYCKLSHLKKGTIKVVKGGWVNRGEIVAYSGNSGRSPYPHIHFQLQSDPFIGSKTIDYPLAKYILKTDEGFELKTFSRPGKDELINNIAKNDSLFKAFNFIPGQSVLFEVETNGGPKELVKWEIKIDIVKNTFIECSKSGSKAWFRNDGTLFYFSHFEGNRKSLLFYFYLGAYKMSLGFYKNLIITDSYPLAVVGNNLMMFWQDFMAPFHIFIKADYRMNYLKMEDDLSTSTILMQSLATMKVSGRTRQKYDFELFIDGPRIRRFDVKTEGLHILAREIES
jgi:urea transporter